MARSHDLQRCTAACGGTPPKIGSRPRDWLIISWCREVPFRYPTGARHRLFRHDAGRTGRKAERKRKEAERSGGPSRSRTFKPRSRNAFLVELNQQLRRFVLHRCCLQVTWRGVLHFAFIAWKSWVVESEVHGLSICRMWERRMAARSAALAVSTSKYPSSIFTPKVF